MMMEYHGIWYHSIYGNGIMALTNDDGMIYDDGITDDGIWWYIMEYDIYIYIYNDLNGIGIMALYIYANSMVQVHNGI